ncbi:hypothetical protein SAMN05216464_11154 [Mucilaginibacter pineti]|uniref:Uncharacterized protein n=1 Tax=Mucilaginibacter pineti TaxID=1391627 RepID=A0A1G7H4C4_9SPHI|nr:hypothetical protein SAMN05216464_11154 [Mucilaginibacter pineti]
MVQSNTFSDNDDMNFYNRHFDFFFAYTEPLSEIRQVINRLVSTVLRVLFVFHNLWTVVRQAGLTPNLLNYLISGFNCVSGEGLTSGGYSSD